MTDDLVGDQEIAILCDVLEGRGANLKPVERKILDQLIVKGFVTVSDDDSPATYKLTSKAQQVLAELCVGLSGG
jgi:predicted transcriptional regulator